MNIKRVLIRGGAALASTLAALAMSAPALPAAQAAGVTVVVAPGGITTGCGGYATTTLTVYPDLSTAVGAVSSGTIWVCPGTYDPAAEIIVTGANKLTIKHVATVTGDSPVLRVVSGAATGITVSGSVNVTLDGLVIDAPTHNDAKTGYTGLYIDTSTVTLNNMTLIGPNASSGVGIQVIEGSQPKTVSMKISKPYIAGFSIGGIIATGLVKLSVSGATIDGTDGGRVAQNVGAVGIQFNGVAGPAGKTATGSVTASSIRNYQNGVEVIDTNAVTISGNRLEDISQRGIVIQSDSAFTANGNKILKNVLQGIGNTGIRVLQTSGAPMTLNTTISSNQFIATRYMQSGLLLGIWLSVVPTTPPQLTATISKNSFLGYDHASPDDILNESGNAVVKLSGNTHTP